MKKYFAFLSGMLLLSVYVQGQSTTTTTTDGPGSGKTILCPAACPATCWFLIDLAFPPSKDSCDGNGYKSVDLNLFFGTTNPRSACRADVDRESQVGKGNVTYILCNGDTCKLTAANFPDFSPYPIHPDSPTPPGKVKLSRACYDAITVTGNPVGGTYKFKGVKNVSADFTMKVYCFCSTGARDTIKDTIPFHQPFIGTVITIEDDTIIYNDTIINPDDSTIIIDADGDGVPDTPKKAYDIESANMLYDATHGLSIKSLYPNPFQDSFKIKLESERAQLLQISVVNYKGEVIHNQLQLVQKGLNSVPVSVEPTLPDGYYYLLIHQEDGNFSTTKLLIKH